MPPTTGNDTINAGALTTDLDGLAGDDLLILHYGTPYENAVIVQVNIDMVYSFFGTVDTYPSSDHAFYMTNFERLHFTGGQMATNWVFAGVGSDTLIGGDRADWLDGSVGADLIFGGMGADTLITAPDRFADSLYGGEGGDWITGVGFGDLADGGAGIDVLRIDLTRADAAVDGTFANLTQNVNWTGF